MLGQIDGYIRRRTKEGAGSHTIAKELTTLRACLKLAKRADLFRGDIQALFPPGFSPAYKPKKRSLSADEVYRLLGVLPEDRAARVAFIVATSACWGETERARPDGKDEQRVDEWGTKRRPSLCADHAREGLLRGCPNRSRHAASAEHPVPAVADPVPGIPERGATRVRQRRRDLRGAA